MKTKVSEASLAINCGLKKWGIFEENCDTFSLTTVFVFVQIEHTNDHDDPS